MKEDQEKLKALVREAVTVLSRNGLMYQREVQVEGLLGITIDNEEVFLINFNEQIHAEGDESQSGPPPPMMKPKMPMPSPRAFRGGRGGMSNRGRGSIPQARKRSIDGDFKPQGSGPNTPSHPSPHGSGVGSPPGTPGTPQNQQHDPDQPPMKKMNNEEDNGAMDEGAKIKMEPGTEEHDDNWAPGDEGDPNNMQVKI